jgi:hypothetical protein
MDNGAIDEKKTEFKVKISAIGTDFINGKHLYDKTRSI